MVQPQSPQGVNGAAGGGGVGRADQCCGYERGDMGQARCELRAGHHEHHASRMEPDRWTPTYAPVLAWMPGEVASHRMAWQLSDASREELFALQSSSVASPPSEASDAQRSEASEGPPSPGSYRPLCFVPGCQRDRADAHKPGSEVCAEHREKAKARGFVSPLETAQLCELAIDDDAPLCPACLSDDEVKAVLRETLAARRYLCSRCNSLFELNRDDIFEAVGSPCDSHRRDGTKCELELAHDGEHRAGSVTWKGRAKRSEKAAPVSLENAGLSPDIRQARADLARISAELEGRRAVAAELVKAIAAACAGEGGSDLLSIADELRDVRSDMRVRETLEAKHAAWVDRLHAEAERAKQARPPAVEVEVPATYRDPGSELEARAAELEELLPHLETAHENSKRLAGGIFGFIAGQTAWALEHARMAVSELRHAAELARKQAGGAR